MNLKSSNFKGSETLLYVFDVQWQGGALHGNFVDATPFSSSMKKNAAGSESESSSLVDELGSMLIARGFNYHGVEVLYSGVYGTELTCEIFIGPVYYQRLRHMVSDKFQVLLKITVTSHLLTVFAVGYHVTCIRFYLEISF